MLGKEKKRTDVNIQPMIQAYYESDEGQAELAAWNEKKDAEDTREQDRKTA